AEIRICHKATAVAVHRRLIGQRDVRTSLPGHHTVPARQGRGPSAEATMLAGDHPSLARYAEALKRRSNGWGRRALSRLLEIKRTYPSAPFIAAVEQALHYGMFDLGRLEALVLERVAGDFFALDDNDTEGGDDDA
ncbi:MAG: hypothetical protein ACREFM_21995, partial [Hypericibacter sp.]